jgi:hypothetical protein
VGLVRSDPCHVKEKGSEWSSMRSSQQELIIRSIWIDKGFRVPHMSFTWMIPTWWADDENVGRETSSCHKHGPTKSDRIQVINGLLFSLLCSEKTPGGHV